MSDHLNPAYWFRLSWDWVPRAHIMTLISHKTQGCQKVVKWVVHLLGANVEETKDQIEIDIMWALGTQSQDGLS